MQSYENIFESSAKEYVFHNNIYNKPLLSRRKSIAFTS